MPRSLHHDEDEDTAGDEKGSKFRTVCVRACDGFYFPMSFAATRKSLNAEGHRCRSLCGDDARLYYMPSPNGEIDQAVDLSGRTYARHTNAFKYRKAQVEGCTCRPAPWSDAEIERHRRYAEEALRKAPAVMALADPAQPTSPTQKSNSEDQQFTAKDTAKKDSTVAEIIAPVERRTERRSALSPAQRTDKIKYVTSRQAPPSGPKNAPPGTLMGLGNGADKYRWPGD